MGCGAAAERGSRDNGPLWQIEEDAMSEDRTNFIKFVTGLATENGETALLLRQKPPQRQR